MGGKLIIAEYSAPLAEIVTLAGEGSLAASPLPNVLPDIGFGDGQIW